MAQWDSVCLPTQETQAPTHGYTLHSCPENPTDREAWQAKAHGDAESDTTQRPDNIILQSGAATPHVLCVPQKVGIFQKLRTPVTTDS